MWSSGCQHFFYKWLDFFLLAVRLSFIWEQQMKVSEHKDQGWINAADDGGLMRPKQLTRAFSYIAGKLGINLTLHELRHTQTTVLADRGVRKTLIMERSGWVDERMLGVYGHTTPDMQEVAVSAMSDFFAKAREAALKAASE
jgi:integrase